MKAEAVICIGNGDTQQILMMCTPDNEIIGTHPTQHSFFLAEVEDNKEFLTIKVHKNTLKNAREHYAECKKNGAEKEVDLNLLRWDSLIGQKIWAFVKQK